MWPNLKKVKPGEQETARDNNQMREMLNALGRLVAAGGIDSVSVGGMMLMRRPLIPRNWFYAQITSTGMDADSVFCYGFEQMVEATNGGYTVVTGGITGGPSGSPAYESNGSETVAVGTIVRMWAGYNNENASIGQEFIFDSGPGGTSTSTVTFKGTVLMQGPTFYQTNSYLTVNVGVGFAVYAPSYYGACIIVAGAQPSTAPASPPIVNWNGAGYYDSTVTTLIKVSFVDYSGSEVGPGPAATLAAIMGSGQQISVQRNNSPLPADKILYWRAYVSIDGGATYTSQPAPGGGAAGDYDIPIAVGTVNLPGPYIEGGSATTGGGATEGCFVLPAMCSAGAVPTATNMVCTIMGDYCYPDFNAIDAPCIWMQMTRGTNGTGSNWKNIIGPAEKGQLITRDGSAAKLLDAVGTDELTFLRKNTGAANSINIEWLDLTTLPVNGGGSYSAGATYAIGIVSGVLTLIPVTTC